MYTRGPLSKKCVQAFVDAGLVMEDKILLAVLLDDAALLSKQLTASKNAHAKKYSFNGTFTPLLQVSLLHICAEYNHVACAEVLVEHGAAINAKQDLMKMTLAGKHRSYIP